MGLTIRMFSPNTSEDGESELIWISVGYKFFGYARTTKGEWLVHGNEHFSMVYLSTMIAITE
jgi:hypothetical protein